MTTFIRELVRGRAGNRCEYCHLPQEALPFATFHVEHIIATQHGGSDDETNLALSCDRCNFSKGPNHLDRPGFQRDRSAVRPAGAELERSLSASRFPDRRAYASRPRNRSAARHERHATRATPRSPANQSLTNRATRVLS